MPPIAAVGLGLAGAGASASGGKKASNAASDAAAQQLALQQQQLAFQKQIYSQFSPYFKSAGDYYTALLKGGTPAMQAVGPTAEQLGQVYRTSGNTIAQNLPAGGERNLALAQNQLAQTHDIARLWAGVQPTAAAGLAGLGTSALGASVGAFPQANTGASIYGLTNLAQQSTNAAGGFGGLIYNALNKAGRG